MSQDQLQRLERLESLVLEIVRGENMELMKNIERLIDFPSMTLDELSDVQITSPSTGQVLKRSGSLWVNGTDNVV